MVSFFWLVTDTYAIEKSLLFRLHYEAEYLEPIKSVETFTLYHKNMHLELRADANFFGSYRFKYIYLYGIKKDMKKSALSA